MGKYNVAVVGIGAVGQMLLDVMEERNFPVNELKVLATERSAGRRVGFKGSEFTVEETTPESFKNIDIALFAGGGASKLFAKEAVSRGAVVIDNSSTFRLDPDVPLVVPEVNSGDVETHKGIIANPNCSTIQMVVALNPIHRAAKIKRVVVSTYQAVSGAGSDAIDELTEQTGAVLAGRSLKNNVFPHQIAFNAIPHIDIFMDNFSTKEEMKMVNETKKILGDDSIKITATAVRIPVYTGHAESINIQTEKEITAEEARKILSEAPGVIVRDDVTQNIYPLPSECVGRDEVFVGRIRADETVEYGLNIWVVADNLRKGAATNAVQIAEVVLEKGII